MNRTTIPVKLPPSLGNAARKLAEEDGVSLNQWVSLAVAQKISSVETAEAFFKRRSQGADQVDFLEILRNAPDRRPIRGTNSRQPAPNNIPIRGMTRSRPHCSRPSSGLWTSRPVHFRPWLAGANRAAQNDGGNAVRKS